MAEAVLLGQNNGGSDLVNLMDLYDADKWEWHYITKDNLSFPYTEWTEIIDVKHQEGYLIGVVLYNGNNVDSFLRVNINNICYLNNKNRSGIMWQEAIYTKNSGAYLNFYEVNLYYQNYCKPFLNTPVASDNSSINTESRLLTCVTPLPFSSFSVLIKNSDSSKSTDNFACVYVTKKS